MTPEPPYTVAEVAARWRVSRWTTRRYVGRTPVALDAAAKKMTEAMG